MDLVETDEDFVLRADLPGLSEGDVNIELKDNVLSVTGERKSEHEERKEGYYRVERSSDSFSRSLTLPEGVDPRRSRPALTAAWSRCGIQARRAQAAQGRDQHRRAAAGDRGLRDQLTTSLE